MTSYAAETLVLAIGDGATPTEHFTAIGGLTVNDFHLRQEVLPQPDITDDAWQRVRAPAGARSLRISVQGRFTDSASEAQLRAAAWDGLARNFQLQFGNGDVISGPFVIALYGRRGEWGGADMMQATLHSAGEMTFSS